MITAMLATTTGGLGHRRALFLVKQMKRQQLQQQSRLPAFKHLVVSNRQAATTTTTNTTCAPKKEKETTTTTTTTAIEQRQDELESERLSSEALRASQTDRVSQTILKSTPSGVHPYVQLMRLDKPAATGLVYWPAAWAILGTASYTGALVPDLYLLSLFGIGAFAMRSAGCIINDLWDRRLDAQVERTKSRPLASGAVSVPQAVALLGANLSVALGVLLQLDMTTQVLGACCLFPVAMYPLAKRATNWPQAVLGVTFNWGALMGWSAATATAVSAVAPQNIFAFLPVMALYAGCINWTLFYDTIYGFQDVRDDKKLGLKSTSIHLSSESGRRPKLWLSAFAAMATSNWALFGVLTNQEPIFYMSVALAGAHLLKQVLVVNTKSPESCQRQFRSNNVVGALITFGMLASIMIQ